MLKSMFIVLPKASNSLVDTYCHELKRILSDSAEKDGKVTRLEQLHRNFASLFRLAHRNKTIYDTLTQFFIVLSGVLSLVCIFWSTAQESQESKIARIIVGILMSLF